MTEVTIFRVWDILKSFSCMQHSALLLIYIKAVVASTRGESPVLDQRFGNVQIFRVLNMFWKAIPEHGAFKSDASGTIWHLFYSGNFQVIWSYCEVTGRVSLKQFLHVLEIQVR